MTMSSGFIIGVSELFQSSACFVPCTQGFETLRQEVSFKDNSELSRVLDAFEHSTFQKFLKLFRAMLVRVFPEHTLQRGLPDLACAALAQRPQMTNNVLTTPRDEHFAIRFEK